MSTFAIPNEKNTSSKQQIGAIAQLVEQRTENPCVPGSIPGGTTKNLNRSNSVEVFSLYPYLSHMNLNLVGVSQHRMSSSANLKAGYSSAEDLYYIHLRLQVYTYVPESTKGSATLSPLRISPLSGLRGLPLIIHSSTGDWQKCYKTR